MHGMLHDRAASGEDSRAPLKGGLPELARKTTSISSTSSFSEENALHDQAAATIERAKMLITRLQESPMLTPIDHDKTGNKQQCKHSACSQGKQMCQTPLIPHEVPSNDALPQRQVSYAPDNLSTRRCNEFDRTEPSESRQQTPLELFVPSNDELSKTLELLVSLLSKSQEQIRQLKFKNLVLNSTLKNVDSRSEVELNLSKHMYEHVKCKLNIDKQELKEQIRTRDHKISKYRDTIMEKNKQINRLMRILNKTAQYMPTTPSVKAKSNSGSVNSGITCSDSGSKNGSHMLTTLGILASRVLDEESDSTPVTNIAESDHSNWHDSSPSLLAAAPRALKARSHIEELPKELPLSNIHAHHLNSMPNSTKGLEKVSKVLSSKSNEKPSAQQDMQIILPQPPDVSARDTPEQT
ncbi:ADR259Wp [Eremothecium gossypii ATCC 10895]|uniref:ADR259Wp n=1 Tax=Eremothecium gossypii (strain ATCC 10895 / CBS 109.51 / FGSC 9923 / NRRL Y-1056) TaxID=284811 RepID=Q759L7_EREGS|nr:ADR259Wp [Eremothecium gossypii ATCC 10895]AAS52179.1 ADR259Wp [Eremothecium gossypii ATCC 10895]AEY96478.1 FADR259Wp [Eremothecium gossypii FDAG1]